MSSPDFEHNNRQQAKIEFFIDAYQTLLDVAVQKLADLKATLASLSGNTEHHPPASIT